MKAVLSLFQFSELLGISSYAIIVHVKCHSEMHSNVAFNKLDPENIYFNTFKCNWLKVKMSDAQIGLFFFSLAKNDIFSNV